MPATSAASSLASDLMGLSLTPTVAATTGGSSGAAAASASENAVVAVPLPSVRYVIYPLLNHLTGKGLQAEYTFGRYVRARVAMFFPSAELNFGVGRGRPSSTGGRRCIRTGWSRCRSF